MNKWVYCRDNMPPYDKDVVFMFPNNFAVGMLREEYEDWVVYSGDNFYCPLCEEDVKPIAWREIPKEW